MDMKNEAQVQDLMTRTIAGMKARSAYRTNRSRSRQIFYEAMIDYLEAPITARAQGKPFGWCEVQAPVELFYAFDVPPLYPEHYSLVVASQGDEIPYLEAAETHNLKDLCSVQKVFMGALYQEQLPRPDFMLGVTHPCDAVLYALQHAAFPKKHTPCVCKAEGYVCGLPLFQLDGPYWNDEGSLTYYSGEIEAAIEFMEKVLGRKMDREKLEQVVANTVETFRLLGLNNQLVKTIPTPRRSRDMARQAFVFNNLSGTQAAIDYLTAFNKEMQDLVDKGEGAVPNERLRLGWLNAQAYSFLPFFDEMEREFGAVVVTDNLCSGWRGGDGEGGEPLFKYDQENPVWTLASKALSHYGSTCYKDANSFSEVVIRMVKNYRLDGIVFSAHWGCKNICAVIKHIREDLMEATGVPMLVLESDCLDQRTNPIDKMMDLAREYIEMLDQRKD
jgi:benzoyl-CoA reductase/2-hydroxyglutaryl-CoA dehydratase subunit BcrC/BadD/HgdB